MDTSLTSNVPCGGMRDSARLALSCRTTPTVSPDKTFPFRSGTVLSYGQHHFRIGRNGIHADLEGRETVRVVKDRERGNSQRSGKGVTDADCDVREPRLAYIDDSMTRRQ